MQLFARRLRSVDHGGRYLCGLLPVASSSRGDLPVLTAGRTSTWRQQRVGPLAVRRSAGPSERAWRDIERGAGREAIGGRACMACSEGVSRQENGERAGGGGAGCRSPLDHERWCRTGGLAAESGGESEGAYGAARAPVGAGEDTWCSAVGDCATRAHRSPGMRYAYPGCAVGPGDGWPRCQAVSVLWSASRPSR